MTQHDADERKWYEDRDFPEIKASNADVLAVVVDMRERYRLIEIHNAVLWTLAHEHARSAKLVEALEEIKDSDCDQACLDGLGACDACIAKFALASYRAESGEK
jgi:hypothetical protein